MRLTTLVVVLSLLKPLTPGLLLSTPVAMSWPDEKMARVSRDRWPRVLNSKREG